MAKGHPMAPLRVSTAITIQSTPGIIANSGLSALIKATVSANNKVAKAYLLSTCLGLNIGLLWFTHGYFAGFLAQVTAPMP